MPGQIKVRGARVHNLKNIDVDVPLNQIVATAGVSGTSKTTLILESLVPGLTAAVNGQKLPGHVRAVEAAGIRQVKLINATPIGVNVCSTVATYANVHDELRKIIARTPDAKRLGFKAGDFSYNTGKLRCPTCDGTGVIDLDVQFLPDVTIPCPECGGSRYGKDADKVRHGDYTLPKLMAMDVNTALEVFKDMKLVRERLQVLQDLGLGYLTLDQPVRRRGPAAEAGQRDGKNAVRRPVRV